MSNPSTPLPSNPAQNAGPTILGVTLALTILAFLVYCTRLYVRIRMVRNTGWDDYLMSFAMLLAIIGQGIIISEVHYGAGRHIGDINPDSATIGEKVNFISQPFYVWCGCFVKLSVGFALLRIAATRSWRLAIITVMLFMAVMTTAGFFTIMFQCTNLAILWDPTTPSKCWSISTLQALSYTNSGVNILTDLCFAIFIPIPMLWNLHLNQRTKISVMLILSVGVFACTASIIKIPTIINYGKSNDRLWDTRNLTIWTVAENTTGIIAGSLPCIKPLFARILASTSGSWSGTRPQYTNNHSKPVSSSFYRNLGSKADRADDTESQTRFGISDEAHIMSKTHRTTIKAHDLSSNASDDSLERMAQGRVPGHGEGNIMKTTTTTVTPWDEDKGQLPS